MSDAPKVLELKTTIQIDKTIKLIDINGKKINFMSDCIVMPKQPKTAPTFLISIVQQDELDAGSIPFEKFDGTFSRRVMYESPEGEHKNHYIVVKKVPEDKSNEPIECDVVIRLTELPAPEPEPTQDQPTEPSAEQEENDLKNQLFQLSQTKEYEESSNHINEKADTDRSSMYRTIAIGCLIIFIFILIKKI